ncbi:MAG TPA: heme-binding domain-containing protein [Candidatus Polarisedimenticolia bacterium]
MKTALKRSIIAVGVAAALIQLVPVQRSNPPIGSDLPAPEPVRSILRRACYDCHSDETVWPLYSHVAPVSWLVTGDVGEAREAMNFSDWSQYDPARQTRMLAQIWKEIDADEMPLWYYKMMDRRAALSAADKAALRAWTAGEAPAAAR